MMPTSNAKHILKMNLYRVLDAIDNHDLHELRDAHLQLQANAITFAALVCSSDEIIVTVAKMDIPLHEGNIEWLEKLFDAGWSITAVR